jgi:UDP-N-acetylmuramate--alanine ligase
MVIKGSANSIVRKTRVHFIGIGGSGLSAIARLLMESGYIVTGSDKTLSPLAIDLQQAGVTVYMGHHPRNIAGADWVVRSSAVPDDNPEVEAARQTGIPVYKRADFLGRIMEDKYGIAVAGTHGKTTTTAMIAWTLSVLGRDPSFIIGGVSNNFGVNAHAGQGDAFVIEADEYDRMFLGLKPRIEVITNIEHDHPDIFPTFREMQSAFQAFVDLLPTDGTLIACSDDESAFSLLSRARQNGKSVVAYSTRGEMTINSPQWMQSRSVKLNSHGGYDFTAVTNLNSLEPIDVSLQVPGEHNVSNALAALAVIVVLGLPLYKASAALGEFSGTGRRFELHGETKGVTVIDDYAHHPTEIRATLSAARARYPDRTIKAVWQPHTYSRTRTLLFDFVKSFSDADEVFVTDIYAAREPKQEFTSAEIVSAMPHKSAHYTGSIEETTQHLLKNLENGDVLLVLSAGDADRISTEIMKAL